MRSSASLVGLSVEPSAKIANRCVLLFDRHALRGDDLVLSGDSSSLRRNAASTAFQVCSFVPSSRT